MTTASGAGAPEPLVHEGRDGWLFLQGGSNYVTALYDRAQGPLSDARIADWQAIIERRVARLRTRGIACAFIVIPDKLSIYDDHQATPLVDPALSPARRLAAQMAHSPAASSFVDLVAPMRLQRNDADLYWRTDTHWTPQGCALGYRVLCERLGLRIVPDLLERPYREAHKIMDLGGRVVPMRWETVREYDFLSSARRVSTNRVTRYLEDPLYEEQVHIGARAQFENAAAPNACSMMVFGDSYCRTTTHGLTGMLAETVGRLDFIWSSSIDWSLVERHNPGIVVFEIAERFLAILPNDQLRLWLLELRQGFRARRLLAARRRAGAA